MWDRELTALADSPRVWLGGPTPLAWVFVRDWVAWHSAYDEPGSSLQQRLRVVQRMIVEAIEQVPPGPIRVVSMCAGQGRDLAGALEGHPRRHDVVGRLVELDPRNARIARRQLEAVGVTTLEVVETDAGISDAYQGAVPADLVLAVGIFGNVVAEDIALTIEQLPQLCAGGAVVLWTRSREPDDLTARIRQWFAAAGFGEIDLVAPPDRSFVVGSQRLLGTPTKLAKGVRFFEFLDEQFPTR